MDNVSVLLKVVDQASPELKRFGENLTKTKTSLTALVATAAKAGAAVGSAVVVGLAALTKSAINTADNMGKTADRIGITVESLSALNFAAGLSDVSLDQLKNAFVRLNQSIAEADDESSKAGRAFRALGVNTRDAEGNLRKADDVFKDVATAFQNLPSGIDKTNFAIDIFGRGIGSDLIPLLNSGASGLEEMRIEAERLGLIISTETAQASAEFNDSLTRVGNAVTGMGLNIAKELVPALNVLASEFVDVIRNGEGFKDFSRGVAEVFKFIAINASSLIGALQVVGKTIGAIIAAGMMVIRGDFTGARNVFRDLGDDVRAVDQRVTQFQDRIREAGKEVRTTSESVQTQTNVVRQNTNATNENAQAQRAAAREQERRRQEYQDLINSIRQEIAGVKDLTFTERIRWEMTDGRYANLTEAQKTYVASLLTELELQRQIAEYEKLRTDLAQKNADVAADTLRNATQQLEQNARYLEILKTQGFSAAEVWRTTNGQLETHRSHIRNLERELARAIGENNQQQINAYTEAIAQANADLQQMERSLSAINTQNAQISRSTENWNRYVGDTRRQLEELAEAAEELQMWFNEGRITAEEYKRIMEDINQQKFDLLKQELTQLQQFTVRAAQAMERSMSSAFFDVMQGKTTDFVNSFKRAIDQIVADMLASQLTNFLFGQVTTGGARGGGFIGQVLGGLFRANGGPVRAGQPYIVGERQPEVFIPNRSGMIYPDTSILGQGGSSNNVNINISVTAMDSQDVIRSIDKVKRQVTDIVTGTIRTYNKGFAL